MDMKSIKCVLMGDGDVGKTALMHRYTTGKFVEENSPTTMGEISTTIKIEGKTVKLNLVDTSGEISYKNLRKHLYIDVDVFLMCFSVVNQDSYSNIKNNWYKEIASYDPNIPIILVGTKIDLREDEYTLSELRKHKKIIQTKENGFNLKSEIKAKKYLECSAQSGEGVKEVFEEIVKIWTQKKKEKTTEQGKKKGNCVIL